MQCPPTEILNKSVKLRMISTEKSLFMHVYLVKENKVQLNFFLVIGNDSDSVFQNKTEYEYGKKKRAESEPESLADPRPPAPPLP